MEVRLIVKTQHSRRVLTIRRPVAFVGRAKGCSVRIPEGDVSRRHCRLVQKDGFLVIEDLRSLNGTFVNGERLTGACAVRPGDAVEIGPLRFIVGYELTPDAKEHLEAFESDVELLPEDSGPDFLEDAEGIEWVEEESAEEEPVELETEPEESVPELVEDHPTQYKSGKPRIMADDNSWVLPTDLQLTDLLEPVEDEDERRTPPRK